MIYFFKVNSILAELDGYSSQCLIGTLQYIQWLSTSATQSDCASPKHESSGLYNLLSVWFLFTLEFYIIASGSGIYPQELFFSA